MYPLFRILKPFAEGLELLRSQDKTDCKGP